MDGDAAIGSALIDGEFRYLLRRAVPGNGNGVVLFLMLNPSTADGECDDPTIRKCRRFAKKWGFAEVRVVNLFAFRSTDPKGLSLAADPIGPHNRRHIQNELGLANRVVAAWGAAKVEGVRAQIDDVTALLSGRAMCLGTNRDGSPKHPLYVSESTELVPFG